MGLTSEKVPAVDPLLIQATNLLLERGVSFPAIAELVLELQRPYNPNLTLQMCLESVARVLEKREVQHAILTGIALDQLAEEKKLPLPLQRIVEEDDALYGIDEIMAFSIVNVYGSIGFTTFGYLDKMKQGILGRLNQKGNGRVNTFLDDIVAAIAAAAAARLAHQAQGWVEYNHNHQEGKKEMAL